MVSSFAASSVHSTLITMPTPSPADQYMNPEELQGLTTIAAARIKAWSP